MAIITWENGLVPEGMEIKQVYGLIFTEDGRIMLKTEQKSDHVNRPRQWEDIWMFFNIS